MTVIFALPKTCMQGVPNYLKHLYLLLYIQILFLSSMKICVYWVNFSDSFSGGVGGGGYGCDGDSGSKRSCGGKHLKMMK